MSTTACRPTCFHIAKDLELDEGALLVERVRSAAVHSARIAIAELAPNVVGAEVSARPVPSKLEQVLASHALIHAAEGELYRDAVVQAGTDLGLEVVAVARGDYDLAPWVQEVGRSLGPPWTKDQKIAATLAWMALD